MNQPYHLNNFLKLLTLSLLLMGLGCSTTIHSDQAKSPELTDKPLPKIKYMPPDPVGQLFNDGPRKVVIYPPDIEPLTKLFANDQLLKKQPEEVSPKKISLDQPNLTKYEEPKAVASLNVQQPANPSPTKQQVFETTLDPEQVIQVEPSRSPIISKPSVEASSISSSNETLESATNVPEAKSSGFPKSAPLMAGLKPNSGKWPITGRPLNVFGAKGNNGEAWRGLVIAGKQNAPVGSIEAGKVVFAQPLRGYGNMIIVDHGKQYMSIYGYNDQLTKGVGDMVQKGEKIATVGKSGPIDTAALYFEVRQNGSAINPNLYLK